MVIIVGLGNPNKKYQKTRHNLGFRVLDEFRKKNNFPDFNFSKKYNAEISEESFNDEKVILVKPQTFMNNSGQSIKSLITYYKLKTTDLFIIHDDIDLPFGEMKISKNRGAAGHKGVQSIINETGSKDFLRFRIGIKPVNNEQQTINNINVEDFVLQKFNKEEEKILKGVVKKTIEAIDMTLKEGQEKAMNKFNSVL